VVTSNESRMPFATEKSVVPFVFTMSGLVNACSERWCRNSPTPCGERTCHPPLDGAAARGVTAARPRPGSARPPSPTRTTRRSACDFALEEEIAARMEPGRGGRAGADCACAEPRARRRARMATAASTGFSPRELITPLYAAEGYRHGFTKAVAGDVHGPTAKRRRVPRIRTATNRLGRIGRTSKAGSAGAAE